MSTDTRLLRLVREDREAWAWLPQFTDRVIAWAERFGQQTGPDLVKQFEAAFVLGQSAFAGWIVIADDTIVGHCLASEALYDGEKVPLVIQCVLDRGQVPRAIIRDGLGQFDAWVRHVGATRAMLVTRRTELRAWRRTFGFAPFRSVLVREVGRG